ncbi:Vomeronasal type-1 receptor 1 [Sciurus carolinensis]|uniref:Vomeronasal type-1 receptor n=1 Tax=Sciurus carolinensis TaxID=30640 RepID=A0AA41MWK4_SCICA|nr:Vomeronasal type-1 receptor 1 [Sciurus carolinensis]
MKLVKGTTFAFLTGLGIAGNIIVLVNYIYLFRCIEKKPIHLFLIHLAFTNILMLFTKGTPRRIASSGLQNLLGNVGCKVVVYLERVAVACPSAPPVYSPWSRPSPSAPEPPGGGGCSPGLHGTSFSCWSSSGYSMP